ncbi:hypothetical protein [Glycomyces paridis]|uniref:Uncharacterized protein n=1 Tax=Glycomyces paridis TaxID=2126555 RepID=A0A4S8P3W7_9ACTN|nr:hypothetical protein [Glycomyces paridis]THV23562.1 hypothetical protein E9998_22465 [Glycomyces paridis]
MWLPLIGKVLFGAIAAAWLGVAGFVLLWGIDLLAVGDRHEAQVTGYGTSLRCVGNFCGQEPYADVEFTEDDGDTVATRIEGDYEIGDEVEILYGPITGRASTSDDQPRAMLFLGAAMIAFAVWIRWWSRRRAAGTDKKTGPEAESERGDNAEPERGPDSDSEPEAKGGNGTQDIGTPSSP